MSLRDAMRRRLAALRSGLLADAGTATLEFLILMPTMFFFIANAGEATTILGRGALLDRALDLTMRDLRLGNLDGKKGDVLKETLCDYAIGLPDCMKAIDIELRPLSPANITAMTDTIRCSNRGEDLKPVLTPVQAGAANQIMLVRVCASYEPMFPTFMGIGAAMPKDENGDYRLVSLSSYVREP